MNNLYLYLCPLNIEVVFDNYILIFKKLKNTFNNYFYKITPKKFKK